MILITTTYLNLLLDTDTHRTLCLLASGVFHQNRQEIICLHHIVFNCVK